MQGGKAAAERAVGWLALKDGEANGDGDSSVARSAYLSFFFTDCLMSRWYVFVPRSLYSFYLICEPHRLILSLPGLSITPPKQPSSASSQ